MAASNLTTLIADAARSAFTELFRTVDEDFYYCTLFTTEEGLCPYPSAWSVQALESASEEYDNPAKMKPLLKWSYSDSPYFMFGEDYFEPVERRFAELPDLFDLKPRQASAELKSRLKAMTAALAQLDREGVFGTGERRANLLLIAERVPPVASDKKRALKLNRRGPALDAWLAEASEG